MNQKKTCPWSGQPCPGTCSFGVDESAPHSHASNPYHGRDLDELMMASWLLVEQYYYQLDAILFRLEGDAIDVALAKGIQETQAPLLEKLRLIHAEITRQLPGFDMPPWPDMDGFGANGIVIVSVVPVQAEEPAETSKPAAENPRKRHSAAKPFHRFRTAQASPRCNRPADGTVKSKATLRSTAAPNARWPKHRSVGGEKVMAV